MKNHPTVLFLYSELAEYFLACVTKLQDLYNPDIHIVRWELNKQAPFNFKIPEEVNIYSKDDLDLDQLYTLVEDIDPDLIFCCGWMDKDYIEICKHFRKKGTPVIAGMDNHWKGTLKQYIAQLISPFTFQKYFSHFWVAGKPQKKYAEKLGFKDQKIIEGCYSADVDFFSSLYKQKQKNSERTYSRFIYVGRYLQRKGLNELWNAFREFKNKRKTDWELWCLGTGPLEVNKASHPNIRHFGFVQPKELAYYIKKTDVFILPSHHEPWGVVVHEFAAAGFPLICSDNVGAATAFLEDKKNGFLFESGNQDDLENKMHQMADLTREQFYEMVEISLEKSKKITPETWSHTLMSVLN